MCNASLNGDRHYLLASRQSLLHKAKTEHSQKVIPKLQLVQSLNKNREK